MRPLFVSFLIIALSILSGCSVGDFIGAYFNTYYNAQRVFNEAEQELLNSATGPTVLKSERQFLAPFEVSSQAKTKFASVIERCSKLLQYHPDSKLVDDALLMIGKSYYYQNEHQAAERKFNELLTSYPESDLRFETKLLLAQTLYRRIDKSSSASVAREVLEEAKKENEDAIVARAANLLGYILREAGDLKSAVESYQLVAQLAETAEERSAAYRSIAEIDILQSDFAGAHNAYAKSADVSSNYVDAYRGEIGQARMLSKIGKYEQSLSLLGILIKNTNYREFFGEIDLELANVYRDEGDYGSAEAQYRYVDTAYSRTEVAANSYYQLGLLYETKLGDYDSARVAYEKGRSEFPQAPITPAVIERSEYLNRYIRYRTELALNDSLREFILAQADSESHQADSTKKFFANDSTLRDSTTFIAHTDTNVQKPPSVPPPPLDTVMARLAFAKSELASLFYSGLGVVDSARHWYQRLLADHPRSPYAPRAVFTLAQMYRDDSTSSKAQVDSLHTEIVERFPESEFVSESRRHLGLPVSKKERDLVEAEFQRAESLTKSGDVAAALRSLRGIAEKDSTSPIAAKAQYAVGWIYENLKVNVDSSVASYQRLVKRFPGSRYAALVQPKLAEVELEKQKKAQEARKDSAVAPAVPKDEGEQKKSLEREGNSGANKEVPSDSLSRISRGRVPMEKKEEDLSNPR